MIDTKLIKRNVSATLRQRRFRQSATEGVWDVPRRMRSWMRMWGEFGVEKEVANEYVEVKKFVTRSGLCFDCAGNTTAEEYKKLKELN